MSSSIGAGCETRASRRQFRRPAGDRHLQHLLRTDPLQRAFPHHRRAIKRGVAEAGGVPLEFPVMSLGESNLRPTPCCFRNLASMDVEESIRANRVDGVVLMVGCDKTTPAPVDGGGELRICPASAFPAAPC